MFHSNFRYASYQPRSVTLFSIEDPEGVQGKVPLPIRKTVSHNLPRTDENF